jgi:ArsR family transcriptional regulator, lead/cadmium/zinc/bismuth-responsive transcriptional repressor
VSKRADTRDSSAADDAVPLERCLTRLVNPQRVAAVRERLPTPEIADELAATFRVLAEPARIKIVSALLEAGELCVCDLAASVGLSETATSQHLRILRAQRAVRNRREGRIVYYALADAHIRLLMDVTLQHVSHGDD